MSLPLNQFLFTHKDITYEVIDGKVKLKTTKLDSAINLVVLLL